MAKKYLITVDDDNVTDEQVMKALLKLRCLVIVSDVPGDKECKHPCEVCGENVEVFTHISCN